MVNQRLTDNPKPWKFGPPSVELTSRSGEPLDSGRCVVVLKQGKCPYCGDEVYFESKTKLKCRGCSEVWMNVKK